MSSPAPCQLAVNIAYQYFERPFDGDPDTLARLIDEGIRNCAEPADYCSFAGDCDQCLNPDKCICEHHAPSALAASPDALPVESQDEVGKAFAELRKIFPDSAYSIRADSFMSNGKRKDVVMVEVRGGQFETPHSTYGQPSLSEAMAKVREYAGKAEQQDSGNEGQSILET